MPINFYLDLSKAFDSLCHYILLEKLAYYGVQNKAKDLLESYLSNRKQFVQIGEGFPSQPNIDGRTTRLSHWPFAFQYCYQ